MLPIIDLIADDAMTSSPPTFQVGPLVRGLAGGAAYGVVAAAISHPFDTLKVRRQAGATAAVGTSVLSRLAGLYKGVGPATAASILFRTLPFIGYEFTRSELRERDLLQHAPLLAAFLGGAVGGTMRGCLETPAELMKTRLQTGGTWSVPVLMRGLGSTCLRNAGVIGLFWVAFEASSTMRSRLPPLASSFVGGGGCSVLAWAAVYPLDTAKSLIQAGGGSTSVVAQLVSIYRAAGIAGWYAGLPSGLLRAFLANGGGMAIYALVQQMLINGSAHGTKLEL